MDIKTEYNLGQSVFFMSENRVCKGIIKRIHIECQDEVDIVISPMGKSVSVFYCVETPHFTDFSVAEYKLFPTKEDLLKSL